jgi:hypothetical protein
LRFGTREFVVYNGDDEQVMTSHAADLLERAPEEIGLHPVPHWKYFWFD